MFGISMWELAIIMLVALIILGPRQLTEVARTVAKLYREVQKLAWEVKHSVDLDSIASPPDYGSKGSPKSASKPSEDRADEVVRKDEDLIPPPGESSGPDFYAQLLESTDEETNTEKPDVEKDESAVPEPTDSEKEIGAKEGTEQ